MNITTLMRYCGAVMLLVGLPLLGVRLTGQPVGRYLEFPPTTRYVEHAPFSWWVFGGLAVTILLALAPFVVTVCRARRSVVPDAVHLDRRFPWWGWAGMLFGMGAWVLAWTRFPWFEPFQRFTFSPQWLAYVVVVNAATWRRSGHCLLVDRPGYLAWLFALSAGFWWFFEYLNRFVQNWYYVGTGTLSPLEYVLFATLPFATVLPAVMSTHEWLATFPRLTVGLERWRPWVPRRPRLLAMVVLGLALTGLAGIGVWPDWLFPMLWVAPVAILATLQALIGRTTIFGDIVRGDWSRLVRLAMAALVCGFFWELWNYHSLARWIYTVPYVNRFKLFEMPLLGYVGYLPFGWECAVIAGAIESLPAAGVPLFRGLGRALGRSVLCALLFLAGVSVLPYLWCSRGADRWYRGDKQVQQELARGVERWITRGLGRDDFHTGMRQFDGEWLFGTYLMAGLGFVQTALEHPEWREHHQRLARRCIDQLMTPDVRAFDQEVWRSDPIESLDADHDHAAFLGYYNLLLGLYRQLDPEPDLVALNDRITAALVRRIERSPIRLLESYPNEVYPVDNCAVIASIAVQSRVAGIDRRVFLEGFHAHLRSQYVDPRSGLLIQAALARTGEPADAPRGSGTTLGLYFLSFSDPALSAELYQAARRELAGTVFGFGGIREYPANVCDDGGDIDSGPVVFGFGLSPTGFLIGGCRIHRDPKLFSRLYATAYAAGAPCRREGRLNFVTGASLGDAILFAMLTAGGAPAVDGKERGP